MALCIWCCSQRARRATSHDMICVGGKSIRAFAKSASRAQQNGPSTKIAQLLVMLSLCNKLLWVRKMGSSLQDSHLIGSEDLGALRALYIFCNRCDITMFSLLM